MKYLKKFNEELKSETYKQVADRLSRKGHAKRAARMLSYVDEVKLKEREQSLLRTIEKYKDSGIFEVKLDVWGTNKEELIANFYLVASCESHWFSDMLVDWLDEDFDWGLSIPFEFGLVPADLETLGKIEKYLDHRMYDSVVWTNRNFCYFIKRQNHLNPSAVVEAPEGIDNQPFKFTSRRDAMRFKKLIVDSLTGVTNWCNLADDLRKAVVMDDEKWIEMCNKHCSEHIIEQSPENNLTEESFQNIVGAFRNLRVNDYYVEV